MRTSFWNVVNGIAAGTFTSSPASSAAMKAALPSSSAFICLPVSRSKSFSLVFSSFAKAALGSSVVAMPAAATAACWHATRRLIPLVPMLRPAADAHEETMRSRRAIVY